MSKKDFKRGILEGRLLAAEEISHFTDNFILVTGRNGLSRDVTTLATVIALRDAEDAAIGNLDYRLNKTKTNWRTR